MKYNKLTLFYIDALIAAYICIYLHIYIRTFSGELIEERRAAHSHAEGREGDVHGGRRRPAYLDRSIK